GRYRPVGPRAGRPPPIRWAVADRRRHGDGRRGGGGGGGGRAAPREGRVSGNASDPARNRCPLTGAPSGRFASRTAAAASAVRSPTEVIARTAAAGEGSGAAAGPPPCGPCFG